MSTPTFPPGRGTGTCSTYYYVLYYYISIGKRVELTIYDKHEICLSQDSVKAIREKYGITRRTVHAIRATGILIYQKLINRDMGSQHRFNTKGGDYNDPKYVTYNKAEAMCEVYRACEKAYYLWCPLTKSIVIDLISQKKTGLTSVSALEDTYRGAGIKVEWGLKFVNVVQFCKIIAHWIAPTELCVLGSLKLCNFYVHIFWYHISLFSFSEITFFYQKMPQKRPWSTER